MKIFNAILLLSGFLVSAPAAQAALPADVAAKARAYMSQRCGNLLRDADAVRLISSEVEAEEVDQGVTDHTYALTYRIEKDSLPPRFVWMTIKEFAASHPLIERFELLAFRTSGYCN